MRKELRMEKTRNGNKAAREEERGQYTPVVTLETIRKPIAVGYDIFFKNQLGNIYYSKTAILTSLSICRFDVCTLSSNSSCCFTKNYTRFIEGTGSVYLMNEDPSRKPQNPEWCRCEVHQNDENAEEKILEHNTVYGMQGRLRYFTPFEVARLHGFPILEYRRFCRLVDEIGEKNKQEEECGKVQKRKQLMYTFPPFLSVKQCYQLLGNGINCFLVSCLLKLLIDR
tara:strand:- start:31 stop:708 length:678 start_codon:yes stop_codon:yes gene_type:complete